ncbi:MAG: ABC transporter ATP-binding protein [Pseudomonadota bacterium]
MINDPASDHTLDHAHDMIRAESLSLDYPTRQGSISVLRSLDFTMPKGQTVGLVGPSGSGKTSLMMVIAGLERPTGGALAVGGVDLIGRSEENLTAFRRRTLGIVFQHFYLIPTMTARENVAVPAELAGEDNPLDRATEALAQVGLRERADHYPGQLSGGEQQRTALARALIMRPPLLMADEPTGNLDGATGRAMADLLFDLPSKMGASLLLITHDQDLAGRCKRIVHLREGRIEEGASAKA